MVPDVAQSEASRVEAFSTRDQPALCEQCGYVRRVEPRREDPGNGKVDRVATRSDPEVARRGVLVVTFKKRRNDQATWWPAGMEKMTPRERVEALERGWWRDGKYIIYKDGRRVKSALDPDHTR